MGMGRRGKERKSTSRKERIGERVGGEKKEEWAGRKGEERRGHGHERKKE